MGSRNHSGSSEPHVGGVRGEGNASMEAETQSGALCCAQECQQPGTAGEDEEQVLLELQQDQPG